MFKQLEINKRETEKGTDEKELRDAIYVFKCGPGLYDIKNFLLILKKFNISKNNEEIQEALIKHIKTRLYANFAPRLKEEVISVLKEIPILKEDEKENIADISKRHQKRKPLEWFNLIEVLNLKNKDILKKYAKEAIFFLFENDDPVEFNNILKNIIIIKNKYNLDHFYNKLLENFFYEYLTMKKLNQVFLILNTKHLKKEFLSQSKVQDAIVNLLSKENEKTLDSNLIKKVKELKILLIPQEKENNMSIVYLQGNKIPFFNNKKASKLFMEELSNSVMELEKAIKNKQIKISSIKMSPYSSSLYIDIGKSDFYSKFKIKDPKLKDKTLVRISDHYTRRGVSNSNLIDLKIFNPSCFTKYINIIVEEIQKGFELIKLKEKKNNSEFYNEESYEYEDEIPIYIDLYYE